MGLNPPLVAQVHAIGIFDIRTFNMDRNTDNLLVRSDPNASTSAGSMRLVPIDHGYILPSYKHLEVSTLSLCAVIQSTAFGKPNPIACHTLL